MEVTWLKLSSVLPTSRMYPTVNGGQVSSCDLPTVINPVDPIKDGIAYVSGTVADSNRWKRPSRCIHLGCGCRHRRVGRRRSGNVSWCGGQGRPLYHVGPLA